MLPHALISMKNKDRFPVKKPNNHVKKQMNILWTINSHGIFTLLEGNSISDLDIDIKQFIGHSVFDLFEDVPSVLDAIHQGFAGERVHTKIELVGLQWDLNCYPLRDNAGNISGLVGIARVISRPVTPSIKHEKVMAIQDLLQTSHTLSEMLTIVRKQIGELFEPIGLIIALSSSNGDMSVKISTGIWKTLEGSNLSPVNSIEFGKVYSSDDVPDNLKSRGKFFVKGFPLAIPSKNIGSLWIASDYAISQSNTQALISICNAAAVALNRGQRFERTQLRLQHFGVLQEIEQLISRKENLISLFDLSMSYIMDQLGAHAVAVLLMNATKDKLECIHGKGIQSVDFYRTSMHLEDCIHHKSNISDIQQDVYKVFECQESCQRAKFFGERGFATFYGVPLVVQEEVIGAIEIFHQQSLSMNRDKSFFLETLASKIAHAIANTGLFNDLLSLKTRLPFLDQYSLISLSRAIRLAEEENKGKALNTAKTAAILAESMGVKKDNLGSLQRGALLHDIGKMGIPEEILNKPGPLSGYEWNIMRKHPVYAYQLIKPIPSLKDSIEIPYCHHEKWDGTGYPRGIRGEQIPVSARIFAVVDVWDALRSNRPYRSAWTDNQARNYIHQQAGKHFDPQVVNKFFELELDKTF